MNKTTLKYFPQNSNIKRQAFRNIRYRITFLYSMELLTVNCPSCGVKTGSMHTLGCPVEVCPWCGGQLNHCNCRFEQLDVEAFTGEAMLDKFAEKLERKG